MGSQHMRYSLGLFVSLFHKIRCTKFKVSASEIGQVGATDDLYKIVTNVNQVLVPVMVKDGSGRLVNGLLPRDFSVYEDGKKQKLNFFTTDPFALSAAVIFDTGLPDVALEKVKQT